MNWDAVDQSLSPVKVDVPASWADAKDPEVVAGMTTDLLSIILGPIKAGR